MARRALGLFLWLCAAPLVRADEPLLMRLPPVVAEERPAPRAERTYGAWLAPAITPEEQAMAFGPPAAQFPQPPLHSERLASHPGEPARVLLQPGTLETAAPAEPPSDVRPGVFQKLIFEATWLAPGGWRGLGESDLKLETILALPCPTRDSPLVITPGFAVRYLDGPAGVDLPPRLYEAYVQFRWLSRLRPGWGIDLAVAPGVFSDFEASSDDALRITGHGALAWEFTERIKLVAGVGYFDRLDVDLLPIGGIIFAPREDLKLELIFPQPRLLRRVYCLGAYGQYVQDWLYLAAEFGGGAWAILRSDRTLDVVDLRDYRLILGLERRVIHGMDARLEVGYVFGREIQYKGPTPDFEPTDTLMLRGALVF